MPDIKAKQIRKSDYCRVLVTETIPYETPLIFSNDGFYTICSSPDLKSKLASTIVDRLVYGTGCKKTFTIPYQYKIRKNSSEFRRLSVIHPISQWKLKGLYENYQHLICHYCGVSKFSIRSPYKVASVFYYKNSWENVGKYKRGTVDEFRSEKKIKHSSSYFSYRGYDRLYKFFNSKMFLGLEKDFGFLKTLDVSKCFDSIYTHSLAWATKEKQFVKSKLKCNTFGNSFDEIIRGANYNETNGIVIGPESSRIFAEIIFQDIDSQVEGKLSDAPYNWRLGEHYSIKRYVDDVFIFAKNLDVANKIYEIYADTLARYNLHTNSSKSAIYKRPFFTSKSKVVRDVNAKVNDFVDKFLIENHKEATLVPKEVHRVDRLVHSFIDSIKSTCSSEQVGYDEVSSYLISAFFERVKKLINVKKTADVHENLKEYRDAIVVFLDVMFFFYSVAPSVSASYKLCASIILLSRFSEKYLGAYERTIKHRVLDLSIELLDGNLAGSESDVENFIFLEAINIVLAISDLGREYMLPLSTVGKIFSDKESYYDLVVSLFYIRDSPCYDSLRSQILSRIDIALQDLSNVQVDTEQACLMLDVFSCPYIDNKRKKKLVDRLCQSLGSPKPSKDEFDVFLTFCSSSYWFVNWREVDLLNALERKELRQVY